MMSKRPLWISFGMFLATLGPASAQQSVWTVRPQGGGWVGVDIEYTIDGERTVAVVQGVVEGSPAEVAGIQAADTLTHIDGQPVSQRVFAALGETLEPGDLVRLTVVRDGRSRDILVEAGRRPPEVAPMTANLQELVIKLDTLRGAILNNLDSLRLSVIESRADSIRGDGMILRVRTAPPTTDTSGEGTLSYRFFQLGPDAVGIPPWPDTLAGWPGSVFVSPDLGVPFEGFLVTSPATDSLRNEIQRLREEIQDVRRQEEARRREIQAAQGYVPEERLRADERIRTLRSREEGLLSERDHLSNRLRRASEAEMQRQWIQVQSRSEEAMAQAQRVQAEALARTRGAETVKDSVRNLYYLQSIRDRSLSPVILGQNAILGAELQPLNPDLAPYFSVQGGVPVHEGVVVLQVVDDTPAADAGLLGGDVIVRVGDDSIASIGDLRLALSVTRGPIRIHVVRKGKAMEVVIPR